MKYIDIRFTFNEVVEDDYVFHDLVAAQLVDSDIPPENVRGITETLAQSDRWNVGAPGAVLAAMESTEPQEFSDFY